MGYMRHHAIIITSWDENRIADAHTKALEVCGGEEFPVSPVSNAATNGYRSFAVFPDGSKEGWDASDEGDRCRKALVEWLDDQRYEDGSTSLAWVEVQYGDENHQTCVVSHSDQAQR